MEYNNNSIEQCTAIALNINGRSILLYNVRKGVFSVLASKFANVPPPKSILISSNAFHVSTIKVVGIAFFSSVSGCLEEYLFTCVGRKGGRGVEE